MPIPHADTGPTSGKSSIQDWTDDDASDIEVLNPMPLAFKFPLNLSPTDGDGEIHEVEPVARGGSKKRVASRPSNVPRRHKASGVKNRLRPMATG
jgi:hypothetical protein